MCLVFCLNHLLACLWHGLSVWAGDDGSPCAWVLRGHFDLDSSLRYRYLTSLHWSITQFTPASMEVFPCNTTERAFAVCVLLFALLVLSSFLSSITASVTQLRQLNWKHHRQVILLRTFLRRRRISTSLSLRIMSFVEWKQRNDSRQVRDSDVSLLGCLSDQLRAEMTRELCEPTLLKHPFLFMYSGQSSVAWGRVCTQAVRRLSLAVGDVVFDAGVDADSMYLVLVGRMGYALQRVSMAHVAHSRDDCIMSAGEWCSEVALFTAWVHVGTLCAVKNSEVLAVDAHRFLEVTVKDQKVVEATARYGSSFLQMLNAQAEDGELTDLATRARDFDNDQGLNPRTQRSVDRLRKLTASSSALSSFETPAAK